MPIKDIYQCALKPVVMLMKNPNPKNITALFVRDVILKNSNSMEEVEKTLKDVAVFLLGIDCKDNAMICREFEANVAKILKLAALCPTENDFRGTLDDIIQSK